MVRTFLFCALAAATGCSFGDDRPLNPGGDGGPDGNPDGMDGPPMMDKDHLLLSEVKSTGAEFIEIWNPTNRTIDLSNYYLSDVGDYWRLPATPSVAPDTTDFVVRFPAGATVGPNQVVTVATSGTALPLATYAVDATAGTQLMRDRKVNGGPTISNNNNLGELIALFYWDGASDLVKDVDLVIAGTGATPANGLMTKVAVDGPDADTIATSYKAENGLLGNGMNAESVGTGTSYKRRKLEVGSESQLGNGNGITGDDETSEQLKVTWDGDSANLLSAPTFGVPPSI